MCSWMLCLWCASTSIATLQRNDMLIHDYSTHTHTAYKPHHTHHKRIKEEPPQTNLGIKTPHPTLISSAPKNSLPSRYCSGTPLPLRTHSPLNIARAPAPSPPRPYLPCRDLPCRDSPFTPPDAQRASTCSRSHLSSLTAEVRVRHVGSSKGRRGFRRCARWWRRGGMRGMWFVCRVGDGWVVVVWWWCLLWGGLS